MPSEHPIETIMPMIRRHVPDGVGLVVLLLDWVVPGNVGYFSTDARRDGIAALLRRFVADELPAATAAADREPLPHHGADDLSFETRAFRLAMQQPAGRIARVIRLHLPAQSRFVLYLFEYGPTDRESFTFFCHQCSRLEMVNATMTWLARQPPGLGVSA